MKKWKAWQISLFVLFCIAANCIGRNIGRNYNLPLWLDSFGTVFAGYAGGPACGALVGATSNIMFGAVNHISHVYALTSIALGITVGFAAEKNMFRDLLGSLTVAAIATAFCVLISTPLNLLYNAGSTGNLWGNGVSAFLSNIGLPKVQCALTGEFCVDFLDKFLTMGIFYVLLRIWKKFTERREKKLHPEAERKPENTAVYSEQRAKEKINGGSQSPPSPDGVKKTAGRTGSGPARLLITALLLPVLAARPACAAEPDQDNNNYDADYNDYVQTIFDNNNGIPCGEANDIAQTNDGILWVGTYAGLYRCNGSEFRWMDEYESVRNVNCLYADMEGRLWIGTNDNGLAISINEKVVNVLDEDQGLPSNSVRCITQGSDGYYYVGTAGSMQVLELNDGLKKKGTFPEVGQARSIDADKHGNVAAVTSDGRLFLLKEGQIWSSLRRTDSDGTFESCGFLPDGRLFAGTTSDRIYIYDISKGYFEEKGVIRCEGLVNINDYAPLPSGDILVSADNGIGFLDPKLRFHPINANSFNNSIDSILVDYQGNFWFVSSRLGLLRLARSPFRDIYGTAGIGKKVVNAVEKWQGAYYFGTDSGLDIVDEKGHTALSTPLTEELDGVRIRCIYAEEKDDDSTLWICTFSKGLWAVKPDGSIRIYDAGNSVLGNKARLVRPISGGRIAACGNQGLIILRDGEITESFPYMAEGIGTTILTITEMADGTILAGTDGDGIAVITEGETGGSSAAETSGSSAAKTGSSAAKTGSSAAETGSSAAETGSAGETGGSSAAKAARQVQHIRRRDGLSSDVILRIVRDKAGDGAFLVTSNSLCYMDGDKNVRQLDNFPYYNNYDVWQKDNDTLFVTGSSGIYVVSREELLSGEENISFDLLDSKKGLGSALTANSWNYYDGAGELYLPTDSGVFVLDTEKYKSDTRSYRMMVSSVRLDGVLHGVDRSSPINVGAGISRIDFFPEIINYSIQEPNVGYYLEGFDEDWHIMPQSSLGSITYTNLPGGNYQFHLAVFGNSRSEILEEQIYPVVREREIYDHVWFRFYMLFILLSFVAWITWFAARVRMRRMMEIQQQELEIARQQVEMGNETIAAIANTVDAKDERTSQHSYRVSEYAYLMGKELGMSEEECRNLRNAARMHDIGKIGVPDVILNKPARLTDEEYKVMKSHTLIGADIMRDFTLLDNVVDGALYHHERYDGKGYPAGLKGEEIPYYGRIIGVADAFDAMTANRVYRKQMDFDYVLNEMRKGRGTQFDPKMVDILLHLIDNGTIDLHKLYQTGAPDDSGHTDTELKEADPAGRTSEEKPGESEKADDEAGGQK